MAMKELKEAVYDVVLAVEKCDNVIIFIIF